MVGYNDKILMQTLNNTPQSAGTAEYTNCICKVGKTLPTNECLRYNTKISDGVAPVLEL